MRIPGLTCPQGVCGQVNIRVLVASQRWESGIVLPAHGQHWTAVFPWGSAGVPLQASACTGKGWRTFTARTEGEWGAGGRRGRRGGLQLSLLFISESGAPDSFWVWPALLAEPSRWRGLNYWLFRTSKDNPRKKHTASFSLLPPCPSDTGPGLKRISLSRRRRSVHDPQEASSGSTGPQHITKQPPDADQGPVFGGHLAFCLQPVSI